jgi:hypothetical protein
MLTTLPLCLVSSASSIVLKPPLVARSSRRPIRSPTRLCDETRLCILAWAGGRSDVDEWWVVCNGRGWRVWSLTEGGCGGCDTPLTPLGELLSGTMILVKCLHDKSCIGWPLPPGAAICGDNASKRTSILKISASSCSNCVRDITGSSLGKRGKRMGTVSERWY